MNQYRKESLRRQIKKQRGQVQYNLPKPENGVNYLGKQVPSSNRRSYIWSLNDELTLPVGGRKLG